MRLSSLMKDKRGTLYEIPLLIMFLGMSVAIGVGQGSWWKGPVYAFLILGGIIGGLVFLGALSGKLEKFPTLRVCFAYLVAIVGGGAAAAFAAIFIAPRMADTPAAQLTAMRALAVIGAVGGAALAWMIRKPR